MSNAPTAPAATYIEGAVFLPHEPMTAEEARAVIVATFGEAEAEAIYRRATN